MQQQRKLKEQKKKVQEDSNSSELRWKAREEALEGVAMEGEDTKLLTCDRQWSQIGASAEVALALAARAK